MNKNELIKSSTPLSITDNFSAISSELDNRLKIADNVLVTEDTVKDVKGLRANIRREMEAYDKKFKEIKSEMLAPFNEFEKSYKENIQSKYRSADITLKEQITDVDNKKKQLKEEVIRKYFTDLRTKLNLEHIIEFEKLGINITLNATETALKKEVSNILENVSSEVKSIRLLDNSDEILYEYKQHYIMAKAIADVNTRHNQMKHQQEIDAKIEKASELDKDMAKRVTRARPINNVIAKTLSVKGTNSQMNQLLDAMIKIGIEYEVI